MRCLACGAKMDLVNAVPDKTIRAPGYEQRSFRCMGCSMEERRLAFTPQNALSSADLRPRQTDPVRLVATPSQRLAALGALARAMSKLRGRQDRDS
jgi:hypothetical protein